MIRSKLLALFVLIIFISCNNSQRNEKLDDKTSVVAQTPPMGWNSYDCFGAAVTEEEVKANARFMAEHLKDYGWEYVVVDYCWYWRRL